MKTSHRISILVVVVASLVAMAGCTDDPLYPERGLTLKVVGMSALGSDACYRLWLIYPRNSNDPRGAVTDSIEYHYVRCGRFGIDAAGNPIGLEGGPAALSIPAGLNPDLVRGAIVTVERTDAADTAPGPRVLGGLFATDSSVKIAIMGADSLEAFNGHLEAYVDTTASGATFILNTPTTADDSDFAHGIWFISSDLRYKSLPMLGQPLLATNPLWTYEAWLVHYTSGAEPEFISLGRFDNPINPDDDGPGSAAGPNPERAYPAPGQDFAAPGKERMLNDGSYGVVVGLSPQGIVVDRPTIPLYKLDRIPTDATQLQSIIMTTTGALPAIELSIAP